VKGKRVAKERESFLTVGIMAGKRKFAQPRDGDLVRLATSVRNDRVRGSILAKRKKDI
jgi:hypothetical protein